MYKLFFNSEEVYRNLSLEETLAFALSLHRSSNVKHTIGIVYPDGDVHITLDSDKSVEVDCNVKTS